MDLQLLSTASPAGSPPTTLMNSGSETPLLGATLSEVESLSQSFQNDCVCFCHRWDHGLWQRCTCGGTKLWRADGGVAHTKSYGK